MSAITLPQGAEVAGTIINSVRDQFPDPVYSGSTPQPDTDGGFFKAQTLYRFLTAGLRDISHRVNWFTEGWWAMALRQYVASYTLDARWHNVEDLWVNQYPAFFINEPLTIYPASSSSSGAQPITWSQHGMSGAREVSLWPEPAAADPATTLSSAITTTTQDTISVTSSTGFLSYGWVQIDNELIEYKRLGTNQVSALRRGAAGTTAATHTNGSVVQHCGLWVKGKRTPNPVTLSTDALEVPIAFLYPLELFVMARMRGSEQEYDEARRVWNDYLQACEAIRNDPRWQQLPGYVQVAEYGGSSVGGIAPLGFFGTIIP